MGKQQVRGHSFHYSTANIPMLPLPTHSTTLKRSKEKRYIFKGNFLPHICIGISPAMLSFLLSSLKGKQKLN